MNFDCQLPVFIQLLLGVAILFLTPCKIDGYGIEVQMCFEDNLRTGRAVGTCQKVGDKTQGGWGSKEQ